MTEIVLTRTPSGALAPADDEARETIQRIKVGQGIRVKFSRARNIRFHRLVFALFKLAFDAWEPEQKEYKGEVVAKDFDRFRKDMTILAGFYKAVYNARGEVRVEAESLSFASMDEDRFRQVFAAVLNVVWRNVLSQAGYKSPEEVERVVNELIRFEG